VVRRRKGKSGEEKERKWQGSGEKVSESILIHLTTHSRCRIRQFKSNNNK
jgi:hypothetical protein